MKAPPGEKLSIDEVVENCVLFKLAAADTSRMVTLFALNHFINDQKSLDWFVQNVTSKLGSSDLSKYETYESSEPLGRFTKEVLRRYSPTPVMTERIATKDFKVGGYKIFKGQMINFNLVGMHHSSQVYKNPMQLDFERTSDSANPNTAASNKQPFFAFGSGKRNCIGRYLGELMIQLMLVHVFKRFDLKPVQSLEYGSTVGPTYCPLSCYLRVKPKTNY